MQKNFKSMMLQTFLILSIKQNQLWRSYKINWNDLTEWILIMRQDLVFISMKCFNDLELENSFSLKFEFCNHLTLNEFLLLQSLFVFRYFHIITFTSNNLYYFRCNEKENNTPSKNGRKIQRIIQSTHSWAHLIKLKMNLAIPTLAMHIKDSKFCLQPEKGLRIILCSTPRAPLEPFMFG